MTSNPKLLLAAAFAGSLALAPVALAGGDDGSGASPAAKDGGGRGGRRGRFMRGRAQRLVRALDLTDAQKTALQEARAGAEPVRTELRGKLRAIREEAMKGDGSDASREKRREAAKAAIAEARAKVEPAAQRLLGSLTPEQKAKLAEMAAKRGRTMDDAKLLRGIERLLLKPRFGANR